MRYGQKPKPEPEQYVTVKQFSEWIIELGGHIDGYHKESYGLLKMIIKRIKQIEKKLEERE